MKKLVLLVLFLQCILSVYAQSESGEINLMVTHDGNPVVNANAGLVDTNLGGATNQQGEAVIRKIPPGKYTLQISAIGFKKVSRDVDIKQDSTIDLQIELEKTVTELEQLVVTGTMKETYIEDSPVKVNVITNRFLGKNPSSSLMESVGFINGLYNEVSCGVCGTSSIRINGMQGPYTAVLIDGMPIMGSLASVYGLDGINPQLIQSLEIIKGPNSTLYGSEAMGGVINIRTKNPDEIPQLHLDANVNTHSEANTNFAYSPKTEGFDTFISGNVFHFDHFLDHNKDGFADITKRKRFSLFNKWNIHRPDDRAFDVALKYYHEDRLGGTENFSKELRGSDSIYGEAIQTNRLELLGTYQLPIDKENIRMDYSYSFHDQDSYYGDYHYQAKQQIYVGNLIWDKRFSYDRQLLLGSTLRYDALDQTFDDQRLEDGSTDNRFIPGFFSQYEHIFNTRFMALAGTRIDHYENHGFIFSPRLSTKLDATDHTTLRLNAGTGFRIVNLFTEEHEVLSGSREVVITEDLKPERSYNFSFNLNQIVDIGISVLNIDFDAFYTRFSNQIIPDYSQPNEIRYSNLDRYSITRGLAVNAAHNFPGPLEYSVGFTLQDAYQNTADGNKSLNFAPGWNSVFSISYRFDSIKTSVDYTGRIVGKMHLPEYADAASRSEIFTEQNLNLSRPLFDKFELTTSIKNLFNYTQKNPIIAPDRPFSDDFATDHVFGPLQGRRFLIGLSYTLN